LSLSLKPKELRKYVDVLYTINSKKKTRAYIDHFEMAAGKATKGGLETALLLIAIFIRLRPEYTQENLNIVRPDDLGFYSCRKIYDKNNYDFAIEKICPPKFEIIQNGRPKQTVLTFREIQNRSRHHLIISILLCGDVHYNPGPIKHPCISCKKSVRSNQKAIQCDFCDEWTHLKCTTLSNSEYNILSTGDTEMSTTVNMCQN
jgi:hypothetical protein